MFKRRQKPETGRTVSKAKNKTPVFSYRSSRSRSEVSVEREMYRGSAVSRPGSTDRHKRTKQLLINLPTYAALLLILISVCYAITLSPNPRLQVIDNGQSAVLLRDKQTYLAAGKKLLESSIVNYTKPTVDTSHIALEMEKQFPELGSVNVSIPLIDRHPIMQVTYAEPKLILQTKSGSYVIDASGVALVKTSEVAHPEKLNQPLIIDQSGLLIKQGDHVLTESAVTFILTIQAELKAKGINSAVLTLPATPEELDVSFPNQPYHLKLNLLNDPRQQIGTYLALKQKLEADNTVPKEYIDLRVDERAYFK